MFGALKGACDGGLYIPHHTRRFPGSSKAKKRKAVKYSPEDHRSRIYGLHIEEWTYGVEEKDPEEYEKRFRKWSECLDANKTESYEELYKKVHQAIRADPCFKKASSKKAVKHDFESEKLIQGQMVRFYKGAGKTYKRARRLTNAERKKNVAEKIRIHNEIKAMENEEDDEEEESEEEESD